MLICIKKLWLMCLIPCLLSFAFCFSCTSEKPLSQNSQIFREQTLEDFDLLASKLVPAFDSDNPVIEAGAVIEDFLLGLNSAGRPILGIGVLDPSGEYLTGYSIEDNASAKLRKNEYKGTNFASFEGVGTIVRYKKIVQAPLYLQETTVLVIGFPLIKEDDLLGIVYFSFNSDEFKKKWEISEQEFLRIDFNVEKEETRGFTKNDVR